MDIHKKDAIAVARGDGIGPEIMDATLFILEKAGAKLEIHEVEIGEKVYLRGHPKGIEPSTWETIRTTKAFLKAPISTPQGGGFKSLNVSVRTAMGLYANVRPCISYFPFIETKHPVMDLVIIRENEEDLYTGVEYRQTASVCHALKMISRTGCENIIRYAFEYATRYGRKKVTCFTKDNILKISDGLFHKIFDEIAKEYPHIQNEHWIIDIGAAKLADTPESFDVIVLPNLYGDILSDVAAQIAGSVGLAGSANIGTSGAMFEAIHGSAPRRAGQDIANPSGLLLAAVMMLAHLGQTHVANLIQNAWLKTIEDGIHTYDIYKENTSKLKVGTKAFAAAVVDRLGEKPSKLKEVHYLDSKVSPKKIEAPSHVPKRELVGIDIFIFSQVGVEEIFNKISPLIGPNWQLKTIGNRGVIVWPNPMSETQTVDEWRCRFIPTSEDKVTHHHILSLLQKLTEANIDFTHTENLYLYDGIPGYSPV